MQPFEDMRSDKERKAYAKEQEVKRKRNESRKQYEKIKTVLPNDAPKTFAAFVKMKSAKSERYKELLKDYRIVMKTVNDSFNETPKIFNSETEKILLKIMTLSVEWCIINMVKLFWKKRVKNIVCLLQKKNRLCLMV